MALIQTRDLRILISSKMGGGSSTHSATPTGLIDYGSQAGTVAPLRPLRNSMYQHEMSDNTSILHCLHHYVVLLHHIH